MVIQTWRGYGGVECRFKMRKKPKDLNFLDLNIYNWGVI